MESVANRNAVCCEICKNGFIYLAIKFIYLVIENYKKVKHLGLITSA